MSLKCPACGFDSPDGAAWCDFCKEPFVKKEKAKPKAPAKAAPFEGPPPPAGNALPLDPLEIEQKLAWDWAQAPTPAFSPKVRMAAIALLCSSLAAAVVAAVLLLLSAKSYHGPGEDIPLGKAQIINIPKMGSPTREDSPGGNPP